ncbi:MAG: hypothetical protein KA974_01565 [Saprospiraceae bacterium]|nr:hypothetical protein [Saprospiraceae bacterium]MBP7679688.1 hypothetical protein [Saprospiraceae bacterium]
MLVSSVAITAYAQVQPKDNSPYSVLGLGNFLDANFAQAIGSGGLSSTYYSANHINPLNPAANAFLQSTAFEVGLTGQYTNLKSAAANTNQWSGNLGYISLGFPLISPLKQIIDRKKSKLHWGMNITLQPYTQVGYDVESSVELPNINTVTYKYQGEGQTYKLTWGNGVKYKDMALGVNLNYYFGHLSNSVSTTFEDVPNSYEDSFLDDWSLSSLRFTIGGIYNYYYKTLDDKGKKINSDRKIIFGGYISNPSTFTTHSDRYFMRGRVPLSGGGYAVVDTILAETDKKLKGKLPLEFSLGVAYEKENKRYYGVNLAMGNWANYENELRNDALKNTIRLSAGVEFIPNNNAYEQYAKRIRYRVGAVYETDPRSVSGEQLRRYALTAGLGLPVILPRQQTSFVEFGFEVGKFGTAKYIEETYVKATVGFTLNDNTWFYKRKFN